MCITGYSWARVTPIKEQLAGRREGGFVSSSGEQIEISSITKISEERSFAVPTGVFVSKPSSRPDSILVCVCVGTTSVGDLIIT